MNQKSDKSGMEGWNFDSLLTDTALQVFLRVEKWKEVKNGNSFLSTNKH